MIYTTIYIHIKLITHIVNICVIIYYNILTYHSIYSIILQYTLLHIIFNNLVYFSTYDNI